MKDGSEVELEGVETGSFEEGSTSRHSAGIRANISQESNSNNDECSLPPKTPAPPNVLPPTSPNPDNLTPSSKKKRFSIKKMAKAVGLVRRSSLGNSRSDAEKVLDEKEAASEKKGRKSFFSA
jgi:hypothetical protein